MRHFFWIGMANTEKRENLSLASLRVRLLTQSECSLKRSPWLGLHVPPSPLAALHLLVVPLLGLPHLSISHP